MAPTQPNTGLQDWLNHLSALFPIECVVHVGAGSGFAVSRYAQWNAPRVMLLEADAGLARKLPDSIGLHAGWTARNVLVGATTGEQAFYVATNPNESGVIEPESLSFLWRNLQARERRQLPVTTVDEVLVDAGWKPDSINWLVADCLPALPVLQGAAGSLAGCDVVLARVLVGSASNFGGAGVAEVDAFLSSLGFRPVVRVEERLPAIATAVYVRNRKPAKSAVLPTADGGAPSRAAALERACQEAEAKLASMALTLAEANERLATSEARAEVLAQLNRNQEQGLAAHDAAVAGLNAMLAGKDATITELKGLLTAKEAEFTSMRTQVERQTREHDDEALLQALQLAETKASLTQASQINARLENRLSEHQASVEDLVRSAREQTELAGQRQEQVEQLNRACEELVQQATQRQVRLEELARAVESAATEKSSLSAQVETLQAKLSALQADKEASDRSATTITAELDRAVESAATEKSSLSAQVETLQAKLSALQADKEASDRSATTIAAELDRAVESAATEKSSLSAQVETLQAQLSALRADKEASSHSANTFAAELEQAREALKRREIANEEAARRIDVLQAQLASEQARAQQFLDHKLALEATLAQQSRLLAAHEAKSTALADDHSQRLVQINALQEERTAITASATSLQAEVSRWQQSYEAERANAGELATRLQQISAANVEHARLSAEQRAQIDHLKEETAQALVKIAGQQAELAGAQELSDHLQRITRDHDEHARVSRERLAHIEKLLAEAEERTARISRLEAERGELDYRQRLLDAELVKAEAQIDLIKDVVLREKAF